MTTHPLWQNGKMAIGERERIYREARERVAQRLRETGQQEAADTIMRVPKQKPEKE